MTKMEGEAVVTYLDDLAAICRGDSELGALRAIWLVWPLVRRSSPVSLSCQLVHCPRMSFLRSHSCNLFDPVDFYLFQFSFSCALGFAVFILGVLKKSDSRVTWGVDITTFDGRRLIKGLLTHTAFFRFL